MSGLWVVLISRVGLQIANDGDREKECTKIEREQEISSWCHNKHEHLMYIGMRIIVIVEE